MSASSLEKPAPEDHHDHEGRIIRLEVTVDMLAGTLVTMQHQMDAGFRSLHAKASIRAEYSQARESLRQDMQRLGDKIDQLSRLTIGLIATVVLGLATVVARTVATL